MAQEVSSPLQAEILLPVTFNHFYNGMSNGKLYPSDSAGKKCVSLPKVFGCRCTSFSVVIQMRTAFLK